MNVKTTLTLFLTALLLAQGMNLSWAVSPPNPTESDPKLNTAGGSETLLNIDALTVALGMRNTGFGYRVLFENTIGNDNTGIGSHALRLNINGKGNTASGYSALRNNNGNFNTANGAEAMNTSTSGSNNVASGAKALFFNTSGNNNNGNGTSSLYNNTTGSNNTASGTTALHGNTIGNNNTAVGYQSLYKKVTGNGNLALGANAGFNLTSGSGNVYLANPGLATESNVIRIGVPSHSRTFIGGISGRTAGANAVPVVIDNEGRLGTVVSSARFKQDIKDMKEASRDLLKLRPVTFRYKDSYEDGSKPLEYGLIAEEVAKVYPDLVAYGADGKIETVQYQKLTPMLLNEVQHLNDRLQAEMLKSQQQAQEIVNLKQQITTLQAQSGRIDVIAARLSRMEANQSLASTAP